MPVSPLNNYLRTQRKRLGLSQEEFACLVGVLSGTTISRYEEGKRLPHLEIALACEAIFGASIGDLFPGEFQRVETLVAKRTALLLERLSTRTDKKHERVRVVLESLAERCRHTIHDDTTDTHH